MGWRAGSSGGGGTRATGPVVPHLHGITAYDPFGTGGRGEHDADAPKATDADASTYWTTEHYHSGLAAIGKKGVGLVLDAGRPVTLHRLGIATDTPGFVAVVRAGAQQNYFPRWISSPQTVESQTQFVLHPTAQYRYYLIWITKLGQGYDQAHVNAVDAT